MADEKVNNFLSSIQSPQKIQYSVRQTDFTSSDGYISPTILPTNLVKTPTERVETPIFQSLVDYIPPDDDKPIARPNERPLPSLPETKTSLLQYNKLGSSNIFQSDVSYATWVKFSDDWFDHIPDNLPQLKKPSVGNKIRTYRDGYLWARTITNMVLASLKQQNHANGDPIIIDLGDVGVDAAIVNQDLSYFGYINNTNSFNRMFYREDRRTFVDTQLPLKTGNTMRYKYNKITSPDVRASIAMPRIIEAIKTVVQNILGVYPQSPVGWNGLGFSYYRGSETPKNPTADIQAFKNMADDMTRSNSISYSKKALDVVSFANIPIELYAGQSWPLYLLSTFHFYRKTDGKQSILSQFLGTFSNAFQDMKDKFVLGFTPYWRTYPQERFTPIGTKTFSEIIGEYNDVEENPEAVNWKLDDYTSEFSHFQTKTKTPTRIPMHEEEIKEFFGWLGYDEQKPWQSRKPYGLTSFKWSLEREDLSGDVTWPSTEDYPRATRRRLVKGKSAWRDGGMKTMKSRNMWTEDMITTASSGYLTWKKSNTSYDLFHPNDLKFYNAKLKSIDQLFLRRGLN